MAFIQCDFFSEVLGTSCSINVLLPQRTRAQVGMQGNSGSGLHPTLWLLHGRSDDHTIWMRRTSIERYAAALGLAVVMPSVSLSWYANTAYGQRYFTFIAEELPELCRGFFPLSDKREDNFIAGLSMGGYGAFLHALRHPERFAAAASLSGVLDIAGFVAKCEAENPDRAREFSAVYGDTAKLPGSEYDLLSLATRARAGSIATGGDTGQTGNALQASAAPLPKLFACCGTEDFLYGENQRFRAQAERLGLPFTYEEGPGAHDWSFWDQWIQRVLQWLPLPEQK